MGNWYQLGLLRKVSICLATTLVLAVLIADATALSEINKGYFYKSSVRGACGWTMFVAIVSLTTLPLLLTRSMQLQRLLNRTGIELSILATLTLFYFISGIALATKTGVKSCLTKQLCHRVKASTALSWLTFFTLFVAMMAVAMIARVQSRLGLPIFSAYSFDIEGQDLSPVPTAAHNVHAASVVGGASYYSAAAEQVHQSPAGSAEKVPEGVGRAASPAMYQYGSAYMDHDPSRSQV
ncbi:hypothetical protein LPJ66_000571 [Kickxella alabastrina]|uniref:Uncharacterized protein n=1 Tax=Kickxella alabastrina TaxID=61397 RepID=A0ACC1IVK8_9FUNG|nr:hypothetical protein LPJ66_000571 [Kickxella alabastrina]